MQRRLVGRVAMLLLLAGVTVVALTAMPIAIRFLQGSAPDAAHRGIAHVMWERGWAVGPPAPREASTYAPKPSDYAHGGHAGLALLEELLKEQGGDEEQESVEQLGAVATRDLVLLKRAEPDADVVYEVPRGQVMLVMKDTGRWLMMAVKLPDRIKLGWTTREQVTIVR